MSAVSSLEARYHSGALLSVSPADAAGFGGFKGFIERGSGVGVQIIQHQAHFERLGKVDVD